MPCSNSRLVFWGRWTSATRRAAALAPGPMTTATATWLSTETRAVSTSGAPPEATYAHLCCRPWFSTRSRGSAIACTSPTARNRGAPFSSTTSAARRRVDPTTNCTSTPMSLVGRVRRSQRHGREAHVTGSNGGQRKYLNESAHA